MNERAVVVMRALRSWWCLAIALVAVGSPMVAVAAPGDPRPDFGSGGIARFAWPNFPFPAFGPQRIRRIAVTPEAIVAVGSLGEVVAVARLTGAGVLDSFPFGPLGNGAFLNSFGPADAVTRPGGGIAITAYGPEGVSGPAGPVYYLLNAATFPEASNESVLAGFVFTGIGPSVRPFPGAIAMQADGRAVVIGTVSGRMVLVRHDQQANLEASFGGASTGLADLDPGTSGVGRAVALQPDGSIVAVGVAGGPSLVVGRFTSAGLVDPSFASDGVQNLTGPPNAFDYVNVHVLPTGRVLVVTDSRITALTGAGVPDAGFGTNGAIDISGIVSTVASPTGDFYVLTASAVTAYTSDGQINTAFASGGVKALQVPGATALALHPAGDLLVGSLDAVSLAVERIEGFPIPTLSIADASIAEGASGDRIVSVVVSLTPPSSSTVHVSWATSPITAAAGTDYRSASGPLTFSPGQATATIDVAVIGDALGEPNESFRITLSSPTGAAIGDGIAVVTIGNDDDRIAPVIASKADVVVESRTAPVAVSFTTPTAMDNRDGAVAVACLPRSGAMFPFGATLVRCSATDRNGNTGQSTFNVIVRTPLTIGAVTNPGNLDKALTRVASDRRVRVTAGGFAPGTDVRLVFLAADGTTTELGGAVAGADGRIDVRPKIPHRAPPGAAEVHAIGDSGDGELIRVWPIVIGP